MSDNDDKRGRPHTNGKLTLVVLVFAVILLASVILVFVVSKQIEANEGADRQIKLSAQGGFSCEYSEAQKLYPFADGVLKVTGERVAYLTLSGNEVFSESVKYSNPQCFTSEDYAVVFDSDGYSLVCLSRDGILFSVPIENKIKSVAIGQKGYVAAITDGDDSYGEVLLFDNKGNTLSQWTSYNSGYPLGVSFNEDCSTMAVTTLNTNGASAVPYIRLFSINSTDKGTEVSDSAMYTTADASSLASVYFIGDDIYAAASDGIFKVEGEELVKLNFDFSSVNYVKVVGGRLFVVYSTSVEQVNRLAVITTSDSVIYDSDIGSDVNSVAVSDSLCAISVDKRIFVFKSDGTITDDISVDEDVLRIGFIEGDRLCAVSTSGVHTVN